MRKEGIYLPTLNSLFMQDVHYRKHLFNLRNCKSSFDNYSTALSINNKDQLPNQVKILVNDKDQSLIRKIKSKVLLRYHSTENSQKDKNNLVPYQKQKLQQRDSENSRIYQILKASKCSGYGRCKNNIENYEELRQRISKFIREGNSIKYKFKKSLQEIEKRKDSTKLNRSQILKQSIVQQAEKILQNYRNKKKQKTQVHNSEDIYVHTMRSNIKNDSTKRNSQQLQFQKSQSMSIIQQNKNSIQKKETDRQRISTQQSFINGLPNSKTQEKIRYTMDYISQIKLKKKEKFKQKFLLPKTVGLKQQKFIPDDLQVVEIQPKLSKTTLKNQQ